MKTSIEHHGMCKFYGAQNKEQLVFAKGSGHLVYDTANNEYIDFVMGFGPVIIGHSSSQFNARLIDYINNGIMLPGYTSWHEEYLSLLLGDQVNNFSATFFKTASEAVTGVLRLATYLTEKKGLVRCGFIGWHDAQIANTVTWHEKPHSPLRQLVRYTEGFRGVKGEELVLNWTDLKLESLEETIVRNKNVISTFIIDAYQFAYMDIGTIKEAISICKKNNVLVIIDETKTGGRISKHGFAIDNELDVDFIIMGKALANGAPLSLIIGKQEFMKYVDHVRISGTFSKELLGIYSALTTIQYMTENNGFSRLSEVGQKVAQLINSRIEHCGLSSIMECKPIFKGTMFEIYFSDNHLGNTGIRSELPRAFSKNGILLFQGHPSFFCLDHEQLDLSAFTEKIDRSLIEWKKCVNFA